MEHDRNSSWPWSSLFFPEITIVTVSNLVMYNIWQNEVTIYNIYALLRNTVYICPLCGCVLWIYIILKSGGLYAR